MALSPYAACLPAPPDADDTWPLLEDDSPLWVSLQTPADAVDAEVVLLSAGGAGGAGAPGALRCLDASHAPDCVRCAAAHQKKPRFGTLTQTRADVRCDAPARRGRRCTPAPPLPDAHLYELVGDPGKCVRPRPAPARDTAGAAPPVREPLSLTPGPSFARASYARARFAGRTA